MGKPGEKGTDLSRAVVRVCPACCTVNPAGPSTSCPHVQLVRFDGLKPELEELLAEVAAARRVWGELNAKLKAAVLEATRDGSAEVETPGASKRKPEADAADERLRLAAQPEAAQPSGRAAPKRRRTGAPPVDPRQLQLLAFSPPKGDA